MKGKRSSSHLDLIYLMSWQRFNTLFTFDFHHYRSIDVKLPTLVTPHRSTRDTSSTTAPDTSTTVFVKGLDSSISEDVMRKALTDTFAECGDVLQASVEYEEEEVLQVWSVERKNMGRGSNFVSPFVSFYLERV
jgi:hypothetical protein